MDPGSRRPYHHGGLRDALLARAELVVREQGLEALSLRDLARHLGVSHGAPSRHFRDKDSLLEALAVRGFERLESELTGAVGTAGSFAERLTAVARAYVRFAATEPTLLELMYAAKHRSAAGTWVPDASDRALSVPLELIAEAQARGEVVAGHPQTVALAIFTCIHGFATLVASGTLDPSANEESLDVTVGHLVRGLTPR